VAVPMRTIHWIDVHMFDADIRRRFAHKQMTTVA
jgi:hypothetical protein